MKKLTLLAAILSTVSFAGLPVLEIRVGALDGVDGIVQSESCVIYSHSKKIDPVELKKLNGKAFNERLLETALKVQKRPSYEVFGYARIAKPKGPPGNVQYLLLERSKSEFRRLGGNAKRLIEIAEEVCGLEATEKDK